MTDLLYRNLQDWPDRTYLYLREKSKFGDFSLKENLLSKKKGNRSRFDNPHNRNCKHDRQNGSLESNLLST
jgi:hypothetical protein